MPDAEILEDNAATLRRFEALAARLSDVDLARDLGEGWNVAVALAHVAFWDRRTVRLLAGWAERTKGFDDEDDNLYNEALLDEWLALPPRRALELALDAAREVNAAVESTSAGVANAVTAQGFEWLLRRAKHRGEHIEQIERALA